MISFQYIHSAAELAPRSADSRSRLYIVTRSSLYSVSQQSGSRGQGKDDGVGGLLGATLYTCVRTFGDPSCALIFSLDPGSKQTCCTPRDLARATGRGPPEFMSIPCKHTKCSSRMQERRLNTHGHSPTGENEPKLPVASKRNKVKQVAGSYTCIPTTNVQAV